MTEDTEVLWRRIDQLESRLVAINEKLHEPARAEHAFEDPARAEHAFEDPAPENKE